MSSRYGGGSKQTDAMGPNGETLLDYSVFDARRAGFGRVVFVIRREGEAVFRERVVSRLEPHIPVSLCYQDPLDLPAGFTPPEERTKPWGTGHAVLAARHEIDGPFCVINADDFYGRDSFASIAGFLRRPITETAPARWAMVGFRLRNTLSGKRESLPWNMLDRLFRAADRRGGADGHFPDSRRRRKPHSGRSLPRAHGRGDRLHEYVGVRAGGV